MTKRKYDTIEETVDEHGVTRVYGYDSKGVKYFINLREVMTRYHELGLDAFTEVV